jgi:hypothetical protein
MRNAIRLVMAGMVALLVLPAAVAIGQEPPSSEFDQYVPDFPGGAGDEAVGGGQGGSGGGQGGSSKGDGSLPPSNLEQLESTGPAGESAANFFEQQAGGSAGAQKSGAGGSGAGTGSKGDDSTSITAATGESQSQLGALVDALTGEGDEGMGIVFPFLLAVIAAGGAAFVIARRVGRDSSL